MPSCLREKCSHFHHSLRQGITLDIISPCGLMALHDTDKNATNDIEPFHQRRQQEVIAQKEKPTHTHTHTMACKTPSLIGSGAGLCMQAGFCPPIARVQCIVHTQAMSTGYRVGCGMAIYLTDSYGFSSLKAITHSFATPSQCFSVLFNPCLSPCSCLQNDFSWKGLAGKPRRSHAMPKYVK